MSDSFDLNNDQNMLSMEKEYETKEESNPINFSDESIPNASENTDPNDPTVTNSIDNLIPMDKIKNGWFAFSAFVITRSSAAAEIVKEKIVTSEMYNTETMKNFRQSASENWEKTAIAAAPYWEKTKNTVSQAAEITKEKAIIVAEAAKPTIDTMATEAVAAGKYAVEHAKPTMESIATETVAAGKFAVEKVVEVTGLVQEEIVKLSNSRNNGGASSRTAEYTPSALDDAMKGGAAMTV